MKLEVMLSVMNVKKPDLTKMNITSKCTVINQCKKNNYEQYKNFNIYSYNEVGTSNSRNRALKHITEDIVLICDDDVIYTNTYEQDALNEFKNNPKADVIIFNYDVKNRNKRVIKKRKKLHIYNSLNYASYNIAFKKDSILNNNIKFDILFGPGAKFSHGEDSIFIKDLFKNNLKVYSSPIYLGTVYNNNSTWFDGYNEKYFYDKGALFTAISKKKRHLLMIQYLLRHRNILKKYQFIKTYKIMLKGSKEYLNEKRTTSK